MAEKKLDIKITGDNAPYKKAIEQSIQSSRNLDQAAATAAAKMIENARKTGNVQVREAERAAKAHRDFGQAGIGAMIGIGASSAIATQGLAKLKTMADGVQQAITKAADESRRLASGLASDRDKQRELAATLGVKADNAFALENARFGKTAAMRTDETIAFRNQLANSGVQFKGTNLSDLAYGQYEQKAAALATARGLAADTAGDFFGGVLGLKNYGRAPDAAAQALAVGNRQLAILGQGRGEQAVLARQQAMVNASMFSDDKMRGAIQSPEEAAALVSVAAEKSPAAAYEMLRASVRGLSDYSDAKSGPLLGEAGIKSGQSIIEKLKLLAPVIEQRAKAGGTTVEEELAKSFPDSLTSEGIGVFLNKGVAGGLFAKRAELARSLGGTAPALGMISEFQASETGQARIADADLALAQAARGAENSRIDILNRQAIAKLVREKKIDTTEANVNDFLRGMIPFSSIDAARQQRISEESQNMLDLRADEAGTSRVNRFVLTAEDRDRNMNRAFDEIQNAGVSPLAPSKAEQLLEEQNQMMRNANRTPPVLPPPQLPQFRR